MGGELRIKLDISFIDLFLILIKNNVLGYKTKLSQFIYAKIYFYKLYGSQL